MIDATGLTKVFGDKVAVDDLSFSVRSGMVTGFLGPNGAGKSTTMRLILGLDHPTKGHCRVNGRSYRYTKAPMTEVGALLEAKSVHPGRTARSHLKALAATHGIPTRRVDEVIELVGLAGVANKRAGEYSLGMGQRLGLAAALLGDPETLILDEPINGLDPEGVAWVRSLLKYLAEEGRTVFISSHLMSEMALTADHIIIIGRGRLITDSPMSDLIDRASGKVVKLRSPDAVQIREVVARSGRTVTDTDDGALLISGLSAEAVGKEAARRGWTLYELTPVQRSLEDIYMELTDSSQEFRSEGLVSEPAPVEAPVELKDVEQEVDEEDYDEEDEAPYVPARARTPEPTTHVSRPASLDQRSRTTEPNYRTPSAQATSYATAPLTRPRLTEPSPRLQPSEPSLRPQLSEPLPRPRPPLSGQAPMPRPTLPDSLLPARPLPTRPRSLDSDVLPTRPRMLDTDPVSPPRPRPSSLYSDSVLRPSSEPYLRRTSAALPSRTPETASSRTPEPVSSRTPEPAPRLTSDPVPRARFMEAMDSDYRTRPRPTDSDLYRPRPSQLLPDKPGDSGSETSADPLRLPRPRSGGDPLPLPESRQRPASDPNRPRRAWGV